MNTERTEELLESKEPDKKETKSHRFGKKQKILAAIIVCALVVAGVLIYLFAYRPAQVSKNLELAQKYLDEENYDEAILAYNEAIHIDAKNKDAYVGLGKVYMAQEDYEQAETSLRTGIDTIEETSDKVDLYSGLIDVYETAGKDEDSIKELEDEAFDVTGDRQFGFETEYRLARYLENLTLNVNSMIPTFESAEDIDINWIASRAMSGIETSAEEAEILKNAKKIDGYQPLGVIDMSIQANAQRTINPNITLTKDYDYKLVGEGMAERQYDKETGVVYSRAIGGMSGNVDRDFYVTGLTKKDGNYIIEGVYFKLEFPVEKYGSFDYGKEANGYTADVYDSDTGKKVGTAKRKISGSQKVEGFGERLENAVTYTYSLTDKSSKIYRYVLTDNPDGAIEKGSGNYFDGCGPYYLLSRTATEQTLAEAPEPTVNERALKKQNLETAKALYKELVNEKDTGRSNSSSSIFSTEPEFALIDFNDDGIPELYYRGTNMAEGDSISTVTNGEIKTQAIWHDGASYIEGEGLVCVSGGRMGYYYDTIYRIDNQKGIEQINNGRYQDPDGKPANDANGNPVYDYFWDDEEVTKDEYDEKLNTVFDQSKATSITDVDMYSAQEILSQIDAL